jgi:hypothetical protein
VDLVTALKDGAAGPHWIVTNDDKFRFKTVGANQTGWTKYYSGATNTDGKSTLTYGDDYESSNFELLPAEINTVVYYGAWRRPSNGDVWTENTAALWSEADCDVTDDTDAGDHKVNNASILMTANHAVNIPACAYPSTGDLNYDFSSAVFSDFNVPSLNVWLKRSAGSVWIDLVCTTGSFRYIAWNDGTSKGIMTDADRWYHINAPIGDYANMQEEIWDNVLGTASWDDIQAVAITGSAGVGTKVWIDGLYFGDSAVCRVATNTSVTPDCMTLTVDNIGKDDSLVASDDSGVMAQLAKAELQRQTTEAFVGNLKCQMFPSALPGQLWSVTAADFRAAKLEHEIHSGDYSTTLYLTNDLINGKTRLRYDDVNKVYASIRPEWQDRQASNIKAGSVDYRIARLVKDYAP